MSLATNKSFKDITNHSLQGGITCPTQRAHIDCEGACDDR